MLQRANTPIRNPGKYLDFYIERPPEGWEDRSSLNVVNECLGLARLSRGDMISPDQTCEIAFRRQYVYWLLRTRGWSLTRIAQVTHRTCHTTVGYGIARFNFICSELGIL